MFQVCGGILAVLSLLGLLHYAIWAILKGKRCLPGSAQKAKVEDEDQTEAGKESDASGSLESVVVVGGSQEPSSSTQPEPRGPEASHSRNTEDEQTVMETSQTEAF